MNVDIDVRLGETVTTPTANDRHSPLSTGLQFGYGLGQLLDGASSNAINIFLLFYLTAVCGLSGSAAGIAISAGLVIDAVADPVIGFLSDGWRSRWGRRLPFMLTAVLPASISLVLLFSLPRSVGGTALFWLVMLASLLLRLSISLFNLPYLALGAEITDNHKERMTIAAWRWGLGMAAGLTAVALGFGVFLKGPGGLMQRDAYSAFGLACATLMAIGAIVSIVVGHRLRGRMHEGLQATGGNLANFIAGVIELFKNASFRALFASAILFFVSLGLSLSLGLHANTFFWHLETNETQLVTLSLFVGLLLGAPLAGLFGRFEKRTAMIAGWTGMMFALAIPVTLRLLGLLPLTHMPLAELLAGVSLFSGAMGSIVAVAFGAMMADAADEHEYLFQIRREGLYFAGWSFAAKTSAGIGTLLAGLILEFIGFPKDIAAAGGTHANLAPRTIELLGICVGPGTAAIGLAGIVVMFGYRLNRRRHAEILLSLAERRNGHAART